MSKLIISQSMLKDWESMCGEAFRIKWFVPYEKEEDNPFYIGNKEVIQLGNIYEQKIIGISRGGKVTKPTADLVKKEVYKRMLEQAAYTKEWYRKIKEEGKVLGVQDRIEVSFEMNGVIVHIDGNLDINYMLNNGRFSLKDLKLSSDRDTDYGDFQWKNLSRINYTQAKQYILLVHLKFNEPIENIEFEYHIADTSTKKRVKIINVVASEETIEEHKHRLYHAYNEISEALMIDYFPIKNDYDRCSICPVREECKHRNKEPMVEYIEI